VKNDNGQVFSEYCTSYLPVIT